MRFTFAALSAFALASVSAAIPLQANVTLSERTYTNERMTWFVPGLGSCGAWNGDADMIVALNQDQWDNKAHCWQTISISYNGKRVNAQIVDLCPECTYGQLDLSPGVYDALTYPGAHGTPTNPTGPIYGSWDFGNGGSSGGSPPPSSGGNRIHPNGDPSKCLDVQSANFANGTPVQIYDCNGSNAQNWIVHSGSTAVQVAGTNYCLDAGSSPSDGTQMKIWQCYSGLAAQTWFYTGDNRISLENQGKCLDLTNGSKNDGNVMQIWGCTNGNTNQVWTLS